jgi:serine/threonine-protein kinase
MIQKALGARYTLERELGVGGAARVFLAREPGGRRVALKVLHPELLVDIAGERFLREIRLVGRLDHPHIAPLLDSGEESWVVFYTMALADGPTLRERLTDGPLGVPETLRLGAELLDALGHAHAHGIVHRDVKPENIALAAHGAVLLDFGIAHAMDHAGGPRLTRPGTTIGSPRYMSPEQFRGESAPDPRMDLYAAGCVLFECLAGEPPFADASDAVVLRRHAVDPAPDVRTRRPEVPAGVAAALARALGKTPAERWPDAASMRAALLAG